VVALLSSVALAADPPPPVLEVLGPTTVEVGKKCVIKVQTTAKKVTWKIPAGCDAENLDGKRLAVWALPGTYTFVAMVPNGDDVVSIDYVLTVVGPRPPPPGPDPIPPTPPPPEPVKSFRVIFVKDGKNLPIGQNSIPAAAAIQEYLNRKTTPEGGVVGWREYMPNTNAANDLPNMQAVWAAAQPKLKPTDPPCVVIEVNGKVDIYPFKADPAAELARLQSFGGK